MLSMHKTPTVYKLSIKRNRIWKSEQHLYIYGWNQHLDWRCPINCQMYVSPLNEQLHLHHWTDPPTGLKWFFRSHLWLNNKSRRTSTISRVEGDDWTLCISNKRKTIWAKSHAWSSPTNRHEMCPDSFSYLLSSSPPHPLSPSSYLLKADSLPTWHWHTLLYLYFLSWHTHTHTLTFTTHCKDSTLSLIICLLYMLLLSCTSTQAHTHLCAFFALWFSNEAFLWAGVAATGVSD